MSDLTPDKKLLEFLKPFGIGNYQCIDMLLKQIFNLPNPDQRGIESKNKNIILFLDALKNQHFIDTKKIVIANKLFTVNASIQVAGIDYLHNQSSLKNSLTEEIKPIIHTTRSITPKKPKIRSAIEMVSWLIGIIVGLIVIWQFIFPNIFKSNSNITKTDSTRVSISDSSKVDSINTLLLKKESNKKDTGTLNKNPYIGLLTMKSKDTTTPPRIITYKTVKLPGQRLVTQKDIDRIRAFIPSGYSLSIHFQASDEESRVYAYELFNLLNKLDISIYAVQSAWKLNLTNDDAYSNFVIEKQDWLNRINVHIKTNTYLVPDNP